MHWEMRLVYLVDIIVFGMMVETAIHTCIHDAGRGLSHKKCSFLQKEDNNFLGYVVSGDGITTDPSKIAF